VNQEDGWMHKPREEDRQGNLTQVLQWSAVQRTISCCCETAQTKTQLLFRGIIVFKPEEAETSLEIFFALSMHCVVHLPTFS
jgi:hypothetical protein